MSMHLCPEIRGVEPMMPKDKALEALQLLLPACSQLTSSIPAGDCINVRVLVGLPDRWAHQKMFSELKSCISHGPWPMLNARIHVCKGVYC